MNTKIALTVLMVTASAARGAGDAENGQRLYEGRCIGCHSIDANRVGPAHRGVFGRRAGSVPDYPYSDAVASSTLIWTQESLEKWLANPEAVIPGQRMGYSVSTEADRADLIAYLMSAAVAGAPVADADQ